MEKDMTSNDIVSRSGAQELQFRRKNKNSGPQMTFWLICKTYEMGTAPLLSPLSF